MSEVLKLQEAVRERPQNEKDYHRFVNGMTNHERNQWAKQGYPGGGPRKDVRVLVGLYPKIATRLGLV